MERIDSPLKDCFIVKPRVFNDDRGYFYESYNANTFDKLNGSPVVFVQDNQSKSTYGVLRGLHFQKGNSAQAKLVRVLEGTVLDVAVDLRPESPTFKKWFSVELSAENNLQFFIPRGFAHGFVVLSETAVFAYKCDNFYDKSSEGGLKYDDPAIAVNWKIDVSHAILSDKDKINPLLKEIDCSQLW